jgi:hypothetical protein
MFSEFIAPNYPNALTEKYDENMLKPMLSDKSFYNKDIKRLNCYNKARRTAGEMLVNYCFALGCEEKRLGRVYPENDIGMGSYRHDIRNPCIAKHYWDIDMENAHYCIALYYAKMYNLKHEKIEHYINHRQECLDSVSNNRKKSKTEFLKILYGGQIKDLYNEFIEEHDGDVKEDGSVFLKELESEVKTLMEMLWKINQDLLKIKMGKDKKSIKNKINPKASLMSLLFQTEERKILEMLEYGLKQKGRKLSIRIHDGGCVEKTEGETAFPQEILDELSAEITSFSKIRVKLVSKPIEYAWQPPESALDIYSKYKREFEKNNAFVGSHFIVIHPDGREEDVKTPDMRTRMLKWNYMIFDAVKGKEKKVYFLDEYLEDKNAKRYVRREFNPDVENCPDFVYNLWKGFKAEEYAPKEELDEIRLTKIKDGLKLIQRHMDILTSGHRDALEKWLAWLIQKPHLKTQMAILFRDMDSILAKGGGTGKNLMFTDFFTDKIIGDYLGVNIADNKELYQQFNSIMKNKIFCLVEEASSNQNHSNNDILKSTITKKKITINEKCVAQYDLNDVCNYIFLTNNRNAVPITLGDRRFWVFEVDKSFKGDTEYFQNLVEAMENPDVCYAFYMYLKTIKTFDNVLEFQKYTPKTDAYLEMKLLNLPIIVKWLRSEVIAGTLYNGLISDLFGRFKAFATQNKIASDNLPTQMTFSIDLCRGDYIGSMGGIGDKKHTMNGKKFTFKKDVIVYLMKQLEIIPNEFVYNEIPEPELDVDSECK